MSLRSRTLPSSSGPNDDTLARTWAPVLPDSDRISSGWPAAWNVHASDVQRSMVRWSVASPGAADAGQVALHVDGEHGHAQGRQLAGEDLEGLGLAGPGRARDQAVAVHPRQGDLHAHVGQDLVAEDRRAEDDRGLGQRVARGHLRAERLVHPPPPGPPSRGRAPMIASGGRPGQVRDGRLVLGGPRVRAQDPDDLGLRPELGQRRRARRGRRDRRRGRPRTGTPSGTRARSTGATRAATGSARARRTPRATGGATRARCGRRTRASSAAGRRRPRSRRTPGPRAASPRPRARSPRTGCGCRRPSGRRPRAPRARRCRRPAPRRRRPSRARAGRRSASRHPRCCRWSGRSTAASAGTRRPGRAPRRSSTRARSTRGSRPAAPSSASRTGTDTSPTIGSSNAHRRSRFSRIVPSSELSTGTTPASASPSRTASNTARNDDRATASGSAKNRRTASSANAPGSPV